MKAYRKIEYIAGEGEADGKLIGWLEIDDVNSEQATYSSFDYGSRFGNAKTHYRYYFQYQVEDRMKRVFGARFGIE